MHCFVSKICFLIFQMDITSDIHICGVCKKEFGNLSFFLSHKKQCLILQSGETLFAENEDITLLEDNGLLINETLFDLSVIENNSLPIFLQYYSEEVVTDHDNFEEHLDQISLVQYESSKAQELKKTNAILENNSPTLQEKINDTESDVQNELREETVEETTVLNRKQSHICGVCNLEVPYNRDLQRHLRTHTGERPFMCPFCDKKFARKDKLLTHERIHTGDRRYKCETCDYSTTDSSALWSHRRTHTGDRPHRCQICSYQARSTSHLALHLRTHTGDRPFFCKVKNCDRTFKTSMDLNRHSKAHKLSDRNSPKGMKYIKKGPKMRNKLPIYCTKPHECPHCDAAFVRSDSLRSHVKLHS